MRKPILQFGLCAVLVFAGACGPPKPPGADGGADASPPDASHDSASDVVADVHPVDAAHEGSADAMSADAADAAEEASGPKTYDVSVGMAGITGGSGSMVFVPAALTIHVGDTVRWTWVTNTHTVTSGAAGTADNKFCSTSDTNCSSPSPSNSGTIYSHTFTQAGSYPYFCAVHYPMMTGTIDVQ